ncbi:MAG: EAL domain-containing protein [Actinomycetota bacterium]|nr:EAL domain-containing protein [Actinomycetota bacterium]
MGFTILVALLLAALAVAVGQLLRESIREAALSGAEQTGRVFVELEVGAEEYKNGRLRDQAREDLDTAVETSSALRGARIWNRDLALLYSDRGTSDAPSPRSGPLRTAVAGETASAVSGLEGAGGRLLEIYVPIRLAGDRRPGDVLELHLPYAPVEATIEQRTSALMPSVLRGSRALADLYEARQMPLQRRLRRAMRDGELALAYQPKLDLHTGEISGVEALLRWRPATGRAIPPGEFVPLVEATAVMEALTSHVFELAVRQSAAWAREGIELDVAVNISACNLRDEGLAQRMAERSVAYGLRPESFTLELTESGVSNAPDRELETLRSLRARGFKLSIDDFGIGESSLSRIDLVEFQEVKIDRSFIRHLGEERDPVLVAGIIDLVQALGARVVAEGVESEGAARGLAELGCDAIQGFHLAHPLAPEDLVEWLDAPGAGDRQAARAEPMPVA